MTIQEIHNFQGRVTKKYMTFLAADNHYSKVVLSGRHYLTLQAAYTMSEMGLNLNGIIHSVVLEKQLFQKYPNKQSNSN